tara:strand:- start:307 stop:543 length:237 start_codon:yes stop_codon:yes gene_type:complete
MTLSKKDKKEIEYLNFKNDIKDFANEVGYSNIIRHMIDQFDTIEDITNTQSMELFKLISCLQDALKSYERLKNDLQTV